MDREQLLGIYFTMNKIRKFEEKALHLFESNKLRGSVHLCIGQEATPATVCSMLRDEDYITSTHRGHGHCIAKGADVRYALAELMGANAGAVGVYLSKRGFSFKRGFQPTKDDLERFREDYGISANAPTKK